jgi:hypothetical protein
VDVDCGDVASSSDSIDSAQRNYLDGFVQNARADIAAGRPTKGQRSRAAAEALVAAEAFWRTPSSPIDAEDEQQGGSITVATGIPLLPIRQRRSKRLNL